MGIDESELKKINQQLKYWEGAMASFSTFTDSHFNVLTIKLIKEGESRNFGIGLFTCSYISGPMVWKCENMQVSYDNDEETYVVEDEKSGFFVKCLKISGCENLTDNFEVGYRIKDPV